jgi:hypothetical protein
MKREERKKQGSWFGVEDSGVLNPAVVCCFAASFHED